MKEYYGKNITAIFIYPNYNGDVCGNFITSLALDINFIKERQRRLIDRVLFYLYHPLYRETSDSNFFHYTAVKTSVTRRIIFHMQY